MAKRGLGKGLDALFEDNSVFAEQQGEQMIPISEFTPNPDQPRKEFDRQALEQLADSIREHGVIQPLVVTAQEDGSYLIVAGERRYRAARMAGLTELPAVVRDLSAQQIMEFALIENLQREDLNPMEEAAGYQQLIQEYGFTQEQVAHSVGKSRPVIANALRLIHLPEDVAELVREPVMPERCWRWMIRKRSHKLPNRWWQRTGRCGRWKNTAGKRTHRPSPKNSRTPIWWKPRRRWKKPPAVRFRFRARKRKAAFSFLTTAKRNCISW